MNVAEFTYLLNKPEKVTDEDIDSIEKIIEEFPFFQPAKAVYLKALKNQDSFRYNAALKNTAAYTTDRSILFDLITSKSFAQNEIAKKITKQISEIYDIEVTAEEVIPEKNTTLKEPTDDELVEVKNTKDEVSIPLKAKELPVESFDFDNVDSKAVMDPDLFQPKPTIKNYSVLSLKNYKKLEELANEVKNNSTEEKVEIKPLESNIEEKTEKVLDEKIETKPLEFDIEKKTEKTSQETLKIGKPLEFDSNEKHSFSEWLKLSGIQPIKRENESESENDNNTVEKETNQKKSTATEKFKLIDKFIESKPKIIPSDEKTSKNNIAKEREVEKEELMTVTLARVYLEQKKYKKAIQAYKILSLKYPEKSSFFADQIKAVEKLQQNN